MQAMSHYLKNVFITPPQMHVLVECFSLFTIVVHKERVLIFSQGVGVYSCKIDEFVIVDKFFKF